jgi:hypothetical protein
LGVDKLTHSERQRHAVIYTSGPNSIPDVETFTTRPPIPVLPISKSRAALNPKSRLNLAMLKTIEHNVPVRHYGEVEPEAFVQLRASVLEMLQEGLG